MPTKEKHSGLFPPHVHHWIYFVLLGILVASMPTSRFMMSFSQLLLGANWLLAGNYRENVNRFKTNKAALIFSSLFGIYVIALLWTQDLKYALGKDLVDKLPMLTLTFLVASSKPLSRQQLHILVYLFFASVLVTSFIGFQVYLSGNYTNFRHISPYISHVYLSMMICMTIVMLPWLTHRLTQKTHWLMLAWAVVLWLTVFLFILKSFTGIMCLAGIIVFMVSRAVYRQKNHIITISAFTFVLVGVSLAGFFVWDMYRKISLAIETPPETLIEKTAFGNSYHHDLDNPLRENGHYVFRFISDEELRVVWNERSEMDFDGKDRRGNRLKDTIYRFLASKGEKKDKEGLSGLTEEEIRAIERSVPNYLYLQWPGFQSRVHQTIWEVYWYREKGDPTGYSFAQRIEFWRAAWVAFLEKPILGWGTGDIYDAMYFGLEAIDSPLESYHFKPHNQYFQFLLTLGLAGTIVFFLIYWQFVRFTLAWKQLPFNVFLVIMLVSMLATTPIDAQAGQTFFAFFTLFFGVIYTWELHGQRGSQQS